MSALATIVVFGGGFAAALAIIGLGMLVDRVLTWRQVSRWQRGQRHDYHRRP